MAAPSCESKIVKYLGAALIGGHHTDVVAFKFSDKWLIILTQMQKMGSMISITTDTVVAGSLVPVYNSRVLFGQDEPEIHAFGRTLAQKLGSDLPILLSIALVDHNVLSKNSHNFLSDILKILIPVVKNKPAVAEK